MTLRQPRTWEPGAVVEAYHPMRHRSAEFEPATVVRQIAPDNFYVRVRWADGGEAVTYHLNVRLPGEPDPVRGDCPDCGQWSRVGT